MQRSKKTPGGREPPKPRSNTPSQGPDDPVLAQINFMISRAAYLYLYWVDRSLADAGIDRYLKPGMGPVLFALFKRDNVSMAELVRRTGLVPSTISRTVKAMTQTGVVTTCRDPADARSVVVSLTDTGWSLEGKCMQLAKKIDQIVLRGLGPSDIAAVRKGLARIIENLTAEAGD
jgi:DNA-binding MarR family transcriptional regulator